MEDSMNRNGNADLPLLQATMRVNTLIFGIIFGLLAGLTLLALALAAAGRDDGHAPLLVALLGVFLPGYTQGWLGALAGLFWGGVLGGALAAGIYRINCRVALAGVDELVAMDGGSGEFPAAVLRLHGPSLGIAIGAIGGLGLIATTNWLVLRGTAAESVHAQLVAHFLPGYAVDMPGSLIGAAELFVILYVSSLVLASIYNRVVALRHRRD
jgi:hypothetical protein